MPQATHTSGFKFFAAAEPTAETVVEIFGDISDWWGVGLPQLSYQLRGVAGPIKVRINSLGGDLTQGFAMMNLLRTYGDRVTVEVMGVAASAASFVALGGEKVIMNEGSFMMIHNPWTLSMGNADQIEKDAEALRIMENEMVAVYSSAMRKRKKYDNLSNEELNKQVRDWMNAETWFGSAMAVEVGLADEVSQSDGSASVSDQAIAAIESEVFAKYRNTPTKILNAIQPPMAQEKNTTFDDFVAGLKNLLTGKAEVKPEVEEVVEQPQEDADPVEAAKKLLEESGYTVAEASADETNEEEQPSGQDDPENAQITEAEIQAKIDAAVAAALKKQAAKKDPINPQQQQPKAKRDQLREKGAQAFAGLVDLIRR